MLLYLIDVVYKMKTWKQESLVMVYILHYSIQIDMRHWGPTSRAPQIRVPARGLLEKAKDQGLSKASLT